MIVFKTFWKIIKKYKGTILLYTIILIVFGGINMSTSDNQVDFSATKPDVLIINNDEEVGITKNLINYIKDNSNIIDVEDSEEARNDALFYRDVNYIIYIPENYRNDVLNGLNPEIDYKSTGDYNASLAEMMLTRYIQIQNVYASSIEDETELIEVVNENLSNDTVIEMTSKLNTDENSKLALYYNFASYSLMAIVIYIVCLVLSSFHEETVNKRTIISSMNYKKHNASLLFASLTFSIIVWILFTLLGRALLGEILFTERGIICIVNSLVFIIAALTIALFISTLVNDKNAVNGIVNVVALGSSFLCGAFVPVEFLPDAVLKVAHILPTYWYINSNELLKTMEVINFESMKPVITNTVVLLGFTLLFIILNNMVSKKKQRIG